MDKKRTDRKSKIGTTQVSDRLRVLAQIAKTDGLAARLLWNLGFHSQASWLMLQSIEKYLKALWAKDKNFQSTSKFENRIKKYNHHIEKIHKELDPKYPALKQNFQFYWNDISALRYGKDDLFLYYGHENFRTMEKYVNDICELLKENHKPIYDECLEIIVDSLGWRHSIKDAETILKKILDLGRRTQTQKQKRLF